MRGTRFVPITYAAPVDLAALDAGEQLIALLGEDNARTLLRVLELPTTSGSRSSRRTFQRKDGQALAPSDVPDMPPAVEAPCLPD